MCDNELIRTKAESLFFCCFISSLNTRHALDARPLLLWSYCPLVDIGFSAHDLKGGFVCLRRVAPLTVLMCLQMRILD